MSDLEVPVHTPLTLRLPGGFYAAVHEAALYDYAAMTLRPQGGKLVSDLTPLSNGTRAALVLPAQTPWRMVEPERAVQTSGHFVDSADQVYGDLVGVAFG